MIESLKKNENFVYQKLTPEEMKARGILGRLVGPCADFINPTRNGRKYSEELWEKVFEDPIMKERIESGVCFGELGHPTDREETDIEKIAVCLRELPKKNKEGQLVAVFDILDTPNGRILKTLCDYGSKIGVSSRGTGDLIGNEVDPDTYECQGWDVVLIPAVKAARLEYVTESLDTNSLKLKQALCESLNSATEEERKVMTETLNNLNIDLTNIPEEKQLDEGCEVKEDKCEEECNSENCADKQDETSNETQTTEVEADNDGLAVIASLQEALKDKANLVTQVRELQEKLAVSNAKVDELTEDAKKYKAAMRLLTVEAKKVKDLSSKVKTLEESLKTTTDEYKTQKEELNKITSDNTTNKQLEEAKAVISKQAAEVTTLTESINVLKENNKVEIQKLQESQAAELANSKKMIEELNNKLKKQSKLKEAYKNLANNTVSKYIESKATMLGITPNEIKNRLAESYTVEDIDKVCEDLQAYSLNISKLPIAFTKNVKVKVTEAKNDNLRINANSDDDIDDSLLGLAKIK